MILATVILLPPCAVALCISLYHAYLTHAHHDHP